MRYNFFKKGKKKSYFEDGIRFDSTIELKRYQELKKQQICGVIRDLECHPKFVLVCPFTDNMGVKHKQVNFTPDFRYFDVATNKIIVEECKAVIKYRTKKRRVLKKKLLVNDAYPLRKLLFLKECLTPNMVFLEPDLN